MIRACCLGVITVMETYFILLLKMRNLRTVPTIVTRRTFSVHAKVLKNPLIGKDQ